MRALQGSWVTARESSVEANLYNKLPETYLTGPYSSCTTQAAEKNGHNCPLGQPQGLRFLQHLTTSLSASPTHSHWWAAASIVSGALGIMLGWPGPWGVDHEILRIRNGLFLWSPHKTSPQATPPYCLGFRTQFSSSSWLSVVVM